VDTTKVGEVEPLTEKQRRVLEAILRFIEGEERLPSSRELAAELGYHVKTVYQYLLVLERKGYLTRPNGHIRVADPLRERRGIPVVGQIAAGAPILAIENREGLLSLKDLFGEGELFAVRVEGESMRDAGIVEGDFVIVRRTPKLRQGAIGVCYLGEDQEATVKRFAERRACFELIPENPAFSPIAVRKDDPYFRIGGAVIGVIRRLK